MGSSRATPPAPVRKAVLSVRALEARDCPAAVVASLSHDILNHAPADGNHDQPAMMMAARVRGLNPQPLPP